MLTSPNLTNIIQQKIELFSKLYNINEYQFYFTGVLLAICNNLWDSAVLSNESFLQWEKCTDPAEQEGKGKVELLFYIFMLSK